MKFNTDIKVIVAAVQNSGITDKIMKHVLNEYSKKGNTELDALFIGPENKEIKLEMINVMDRQVCASIMFILGNQDSNDAQIDLAIAALVKPIQTNRIYQNFIVDKPPNPVTKELSNTILRQAAEVFLRAVTENAGNRYWAMHGYNKIVTHLKVANFSQLEKDLAVEMADDNPQLRCILGIG